MRVTFLQRDLEGGDFVKDLLEPELIDLVDGDEQQFVVLWAIAQRLLQREELINFEVRNVGDVLILFHCYPFALSECSLPAFLAI